MEKRFLLRVDEPFALVGLRVQDSWAGQCITMMALSPPSYDTVVLRFDPCDPGVMEAIW